MIKKIECVVCPSQSRAVSDPVMSNRIQSRIMILKPKRIGTTQNFNKNINEAFKGWLIF